MGLKVVCPRCRQVGVLVKRKIGWYVNHGKQTSHYVNKHRSIELYAEATDLNLIQYAGGDFFLLKHIYKMFAPHLTYVEVFGGGAHVLLNKPPSKVEVYNDLDSNLYNLFKVVRDKPDEFLKKAELLIYSRQQYYDYLLKLRQGGFRDDVERAVAYYYVVWAAFFGALGKGFAVRKKRNSARGFFNNLENVRRIHERLKNVVVENLDFRECIRKYDYEDAFFYLDPPHLYIATEKSKDYYAVGFTEEDYFDLLNMLTKIKGKFLLKQSGAVKFLNEWAEKNGFWVRELTLTKSMQKKMGESREHWKCVFIANYEI